ncbi:Thioredoxin [Flagellimonas taeanensis]|uniref:Thioredoxin n=3 Tax=Flagellimonas TaxID=444459 RepID=A0A1M6UKK1_9FLAO|nr:MULTISPECIES: vitamin K epoxide reductase family protein [Allomuricauda]MDF0708093.1 vitamin K epoxide reductase family protein [[Muricauda] okinawensis]SFC55292.1 Thioredoxin [Allomuricauda taeanensis]SHK69706.1 Thioredoxin [Allomuricauda taeanensis]
MGNVKSKKWVKESTEYSNTKVALENLFIIQGEQIPVNEIERDPKYPRIESIVNFLNRNGIENLVVELGEDSLRKIPFPCLAQIIETDDKNLEKGQVRFVVLNSLNGRLCNYLDSKKGWVEIEVDTFLDISTGIFVLVSKPENDDVDSISNVVTDAEDVPSMFSVGTSAAIFFILLIGYIFFAKVGVYGKISFAFSLMGVILSFLLVKEEHNFKTGNGSKLCGILSFKGKSSNSCSEVINSKASKIFGLSFSDVGFIFFGFIVMVLILNTTSYPGTELSLGLIKLLNTAALPFTFFSLFYQGVVIKKWCALCVWTQIIIVVNFILSLFLIEGFNVDFLFNGYPVSIIFTLLLVFIIWKLIRKNYSLSNSLMDTEQKLYVYENDTVVFNGLLKEEKSVPLSTNEYDIVLGNPDSENILLIYTNPLCPSCRKAHQYIDQILKRNQRYFRIVIRFLVAEISENDFTKSPDNLDTALAVSAFQIYRREKSSKDKLGFLKIMEEIYSMETINEKSIDKWISERVGTIDGLEYIEKALRNHKRVAVDNGIEDTPTIYINGIYYRYGILYLKNILNNAYRLKEEVAE